ncbi:MAG: PorT family protein [Bacteroidales bacterium]|nr:PorT family protein [Bacteroidales bacterium]
MRIKGTLLAMAFCAFIMFPLSAQLTVGGFIDFNIAGLSVKPAGSDEDYSSYLGFGLGGIVTYPLSNGLALQGELVLLQKGGKVTEFDETLTLKILYIEIPLFLRYNIAVSESYLPYVILGPNLGFRASAKVVFPDGSSSEANDEFSVIDLGLGLGGGVEVPYGKLIFFGETKYVFGLNDINMESGESTVKNRGLQILIGAKVPIK